MFCFVPRGLLFSLFFFSFLSSAKGYFLFLFWLPLSMVVLLVLWKSQLLSETIIYQTSCRDGLADLAGCTESREVICRLCIIFWSGPEMTGNLGQGGLVGSKQSHSRLIGENIERIYVSFCHCFGCLLKKRKTM
ncbi:hypothetical protein F4775DRAFT_544436 [Biscogniauxia sp. FL1348]|nr:hypothetical protein F4775DRAFT_544436 [Biscogniauxia sp. FL1348]